MTTYSKLCPKCQTACDLAATTCKRCKLKFGTPLDADKPKSGSATPPAGDSRAKIVFGIVGVLLIVLAIQVFGVLQERAKRAEEIKKNSWDAYVQSREFGGPR